MPRLPDPGPLLRGRTTGKVGMQRSIHLPSQLGSDVGNAFTTDTQAEEKAHMDVIVTGMADRVLTDGPVGLATGTLPLRFQACAASLS